jgi:hypothetical protein
VEETIENVDETTNSISTQQETRTRTRYKKNWIKDRFIRILSSLRLMPPIILTELMTMIRRWSEKVGRKIEFLYLFTYFGTVNNYTGSFIRYFIIHFRV